MKAIADIFVNLFVDNAFVMSFLIVGVITMLSNFVSTKITRGRIHASAIAIFLGLILAYIGGTVTGGSKGLADVSIFTGVGVLGASVLRDFTIILTAFGAKLSEIKKCGLIGVVALLVGVVLTFIIGAAMAFGGLMGTTSGVSAGLAATDPKLVPYGAMTATFYTGLGCLLCPSVLYFLVRVFLP